MPPAVSLVHSLVGPSARPPQIGGGRVERRWPIPYELPNKIPVPEANSTSQMDEVGG